MKVLNLRIFADSREKMNLNIKQVKGELFSVFQFTLCADTKKGNCPGFDNAALTYIAEQLWKNFNQNLKKAGLTSRREPLLV